MTSLGDRLKEVLRSRNITQEELAEQANTTGATISRYISGTRTPKLELLSNIANVLNVSIDFLLSKTDIPKYSAEQKELKKTEQALIEMMKQEGWLNADFPVIEENIAKFKEAVKAVGAMYGNKDKK